MAKKKKKEAEDSDEEAGEDAFSHEGDEECDGEYDCGGEGMSENCEYS